MGVVSRGSQSRSGTPPEDIRARTDRFALRVIRLVRALPGDLAGAAIGRQRIQSGMSVGANCEEAEGAATRADFGNKMTIALKEARESSFWLRLVRDSALVKPEFWSRIYGTLHLAGLVDEADELVCVRTAIVRKTKSGD